MKKCYFCKREIKGSVCTKCAEENKLAAVITYFYEEDPSYECNQATLILTYNKKIAMVNLNFDKAAVYANKLVISISNIPVSPANIFFDKVLTFNNVGAAETLIFNEALILYNVNITPQNIKEKLKTYLLFK
jgi:hypothetical protein